jgi:DUF1680 family protein
MKKLLFSFLLLCTYKLYAQNKDYTYVAVPFTSVKLTDNFWLPRLKTNAEVTIPASFARCESTGRVKNFEMAAAHTGKFCTVYPFDDTDIYKTIEGASYSLRIFPNPELEKYIDSLIAIVGRAQEPDGYLYTARTIDPAHPHSWAGTQRWQKERELSHELYNAGHLYEAAVAHYQATGKTNFLTIALKNADLVCNTFGPDKLHVAPGHEIVEMGLVKLYRVTGKQKYLETAKFFIEQRGHYNGYDSTSNDEWKNGSYWQDDKPVVDQTEATGHAVRAGYLYSAVADVAALTGDQQFLRAIDTIWDNVVSKKMYVQGGVGAVGDGERFGDNYELPNATAYNETCAAIAQAFWNQRMFMLHGDSKYIDVLEKVMYNGLISGIGLDGKSFFYTNAMQVKSTSNNEVERERSGWFVCSCCPTNLVRFLPAVPGYIYAQKEDQLYINLFMSSTANINIKNTNVEIVQQNNYPWDGDLKFTVNPKSATDFTVRMRIPGWAHNEAMPSDLYNFQSDDNQQVVIKINGEIINYNMENGYAVLNRKWKKDDKIEMILPMPVRKVVANNKLVEDQGKVALQRGPIMYCAEWVDNDGRAANIILPDNTNFTSSFKPDVLNGVEEITAQVPAIIVDSVNNSVKTVQQNFTAIPYYAWANRGKGEMMVWFPQRVSDIDIIASVQQQKQQPK